jgi:hypothetical protein
MNRPRHYAPRRRSILRSEYEHSNFPNRHPSIRCGGLELTDGAIHLFVAYFDANKSCIFRGGLP